jgi:hypothetical protein
MGKPNSHQPLELWDVHTSRSGIEALPKHIIEGFIPDTLNCVDTPHIFFEKPSGRCCSKTDQDL